MFEVSRVINYNSVILGWAKGGTLEPTSSYFGYAWHWAAVTLLKEISNIKEIVDICWCVCVCIKDVNVCMYIWSNMMRIHIKQRICHFFGQTIRGWSFKTILFKIWGIFEEKNIVSTKGPPLGFELKIINSAGGGCLKIRSGLPKVDKKKLTIVLINFNAQIFNLGTENGSLKVKIIFWHFLFYGLRSKNVREM